MRPAVNRITYASRHGEFETFANPRGTLAIFLARARKGAGIARYEFAFPLRPALVEATPTPLVSY